MPHQGIPFSFPRSGENRRPMNASWNSDFQRISRIFSSVSVLAGGRRGRAYPAGFLVGSTSWAPLAGMGNPLGRWRICDARRRARSRASPTSAKGSARATAKKRPCPLAEAAQEFSCARSGRFGRLGPKSVAVETWLYPIAASRLRPHEQVAFQVRGGRAAGERHREVELGGEVVDDPADARFAAGGEAVDAGTP